MAKIQKFKFHNSFNNLGRHLPRSIHVLTFREQIWRILSEVMSFETFTPVWFRVKENEKKIGKNTNLEIYQFFEQLW